MPRYIFYFAGADIRTDSTAQAAGYVFLIDFTVSRPKTFAMPSAGVAIAKK